MKHGGISFRILAILQVMPMDAAVEDGLTAKEIYEKIPDPYWKDKLSPRKIAQTIAYEMKPYVDYVKFSDKARRYVLSQHGKVILWHNEEIERFAIPPDLLAPVNTTS